MSEQLDFEKRAISAPDDYVQEESYGKEQKNKYEEEYKEEYKEEIKEEEYYPLPKDPRKRTMLFSVISVVLAIFSIGLCVFYIPSVILAALALCAALYSRYILGYFDKPALVGLILSIFGIIFGFGSMILTVCGIMDKLLK